MRDWPYSSLIISIGILVNVAQFACLVLTVRRSRVKQPVTSVFWPAAISVLMALILPVLVVVLVNGGRAALLEDTVEMLGPRMEFVPMRIEWNQQRALLLGASFIFPSFLLAGITVGVALVKKAGAICAVVLSCLGTTALCPFFGGMWLYLYRLRTILYPGLTGADPIERAPILQSALSSGKHALDMGALVTALALSAFLVWHMVRSLFARDPAPPGRWNAKRVLGAATGALALAASSWWVCRPLAAENQMPFPGRGNRFTQRVCPAIPAGLGQEALYALASKVRLGDYGAPLSFPIVSREQNSRFSWAPVLTLSEGRILLNGLSVDQEDLGNQLVHEMSNDRQLRRLHGDQSVRSPLIKAPSDLSSMFLARVLAVVYSKGFREVRFLTGRPETIQRPILGPISRIIYQTTTVALTRTGDDRTGSPRSVLQVAGFARYRDVLDRLLELGEPSSPPTILLDTAERDEDSTALSGKATGR